MILTNSRYEEIKKETGNVIEDYNITSFLCGFIIVNLFEKNLKKTLDNVNLFVL